jgi:hypothetical protein
LPAQIIRFPVERCRPRSSVGVTALMFAPLFFCITMASVLVTPGSLGGDSKQVTTSKDRIGSKTNVYRL